MDLRIAFSSDLNRRPAGAKAGHRRRGVGICLSLCAFHGGCKPFRGAGTIHGRRRGDGAPGDGGRRAREEEGGEEEGGEEEGWRIIINVLEIFY